MSKESIRTRASYFDKVCTENENFVDFINIKLFENDEKYEGNYFKSCKIKE